MDDKTAAMPNQLPQEPNIASSFGRGVRNGFRSRSLLNSDPEISVPSFSFITGWNEPSHSQSDIAFPAALANNPVRESIFGPAIISPMDAVMSSPIQCLRNSRDPPFTTITSTTLEHQAQQAPNARPMMLPTPSLSPTNADKAAQVPRSAHPSISSTSSLHFSVLSTATTQAQRNFFHVLEEICTEAARRYWHSEVECQLIANLATRNRNRPTAPSPGHGVRRERRSPTHRYRPYTLLPRWSTQEVAAARDWQLMDYLSSTADMLWMGARARVVERREAGARAIEEMGWLYGVGMELARGCEVVEEGEVFSVAEVADIVVGAGSLCDWFGYEEGRERCEEMMRDWRATEAGEIL